MGRVLKAANWGLDRIIDGTGFLGIAIMISLSLFVAMVMMSRHVLALNIPGFFDAAMYVLIIFPLITAAFTLRVGRHITMDVFINRLPERAQAVLRIITYLISTVFVFVLVWQGTIWFSRLYSHNIGTQGVWKVPQGLLVGLIVFGAILLIPQIIRIVAKDVRFLVSDKASDAISSQGFLFIAGFIVGFAGAVYLFMEGNAVAATLLLLLVLLFSGMPVFLALGVLGTVALFFSVGSRSLMQIPQVMYNSLDNFTLTCLPLFVFAGIVMERGKLVDDLFKFVEVWIGHFTPSLLIVTIIVGMIICSLTGSPSAATAMLAATAIPALNSRGFKQTMSCGVVGASGAGSLIPPSLGYVVYCVLVEQSIAELFIASIIPAVLLFSLLIIYILVLNVFNKKSLFEDGQIPAKSFEMVSWRERLVLTRKALPILFAPVLVLGSIYTGIFTPTESAAALLLYSIILCLFVKKTLSWRGLYQACSNGAVVSSLILCMLAPAFVFAKVVSQLRLTTTLQGFADTIGLGPLGVIGLIFFTLLILGMCMSGLAIKPLTLPIFYPMAMAVGINPVWLGVFYTINTEMATMTPPFGTDFFVIKALLGIPYMTVLKGILPFILLYITTVVLIIVFPEIALWLPSTMAAR